MDKREKLHLRGLDLDWFDWFKSPHTEIVIGLIIGAGVIILGVLSFDWG